MTLTSNATNKIWLTWGNFLADIDINALTLSKKNTESDAKDWFIPAPPPITTSGIYTSSSGASKISTAIATALILMTIY